MLTKYGKLMRAVQAGRNALRLCEEYIATTTTRSPA